MQSFWIYVISIAALLSNFQTQAHFSQVPSNVYEFELLMVEHSLGTGLTMRYLIPKIKYGSYSLYFPDLMKHTELIEQRATQHDFSKFVHTPKFVEKYYPADQTTHLSAGILRSYGKDIKNPGALSPEEIDLAKYSIHQLNIIDDRLLNDLVEDYAKQKDLPGELKETLKTQLYQYEHMSDLLNRQMFENIYRFRKKLGRDNVSEILEFGRPFKLNDGNKNHWNSGDHTRQIAISFNRSRLLFNLVSNIDPQLVVQNYLAHTENSPFIQTPEAKELRNQTMAQYIRNRETIKPIENKLLKRKTLKQIKSSCQNFYR